MEILKIGNRHDEKNNLKNTYDCYKQNVYENKLKNSEKEHY